MHWNQLSFFFSFCDSFMMLSNHFIQFRLPAFVCFTAMFEFTYSFFQSFFFNTVSIQRLYTPIPLRKSLYGTKSIRTGENPFSSSTLLNGSKSRSDSS